MAAPCFSAGTDMACKQRQKKKTYIYIYRRMMRKIEKGKTIML